MERLNHLPDPLLYLLQREINRGLNSGCAKIILIIVFKTCLYIVYIKHNVCLPHYFVCLLLLHPPPQMLGTQSGYWIII